MRSHVKIVLRLEILIRSIGETFKMESIRYAWDEVESLRRTSGEKELRDQ